jgi:hypothetical protein
VVRGTNSLNSSKSPKSWLGAVRREKRAAKSLLSHAGSHAGEPSQRTEAIPAGDGHRADDRHHSVSPASQLAGELSGRIKFHSNRGDAGVNQAAVPAPGNEPTVNTRLAVTLELDQVSGYLFKGSSECLHE